MSAISNTSYNACSICLSDYEVNDTCAETKCNHLFHRVCLEKWIEQRQFNCPSCRADFTLSPLEISAIAGREDALRQRERRYDFYLNIFFGVMSMLILDLTELKKDKEHAIFADNKLTWFKVVVAMVYYGALKIFQFKIIQERQQLYLQNKSYAYKIVRYS